MLKSGVWDVAEVADIGSGLFEEAIDVWEWFGR